MARPNVIAVCAILNTETGETYIGSSINVFGRFKWHKGGIKQKDHPNPKIQKASEEYNPEDFVYLILEECTPETQYETETEWLQANHPEYNNVWEASYHNIGISFTEETRKLMSEKLMGNQHLLGYKFSEEAKAKSAERMLGNQHAKDHHRIMSEEEKADKSERMIGNTFNLGKKRSVETTNKMSKSMKANWTMRKLLASK